MQTLSGWRKEQGHWEARRKAQGVHWFNEAVRTGLLARITTDTAAMAAMESLAQQVSEGGMSPDRAAAQMLNQLSE